MRVRALVLLFLSVGALGCATPVPPASAHQRAQVRLTLYSTRWCPACAHVRGWLHARGIPYAERDVEQSAAAAARMRQLNRAGTVPTIDVEGEVVVGFSEEALRSAIDRAAHRY